MSSIGITLWEMLEDDKVDKGSGEPNTKKVAKVTKDQVKEIAETKMKGLSASFL